jgi:diguanylate cyclase (GGDEF)-like protein
MRGLPWLCAALALSIPMVILQSVKGVVPDWSSVLLANCFATLSYFAMYRGFAAFVRSQQRPLARELVAFAIGLAIYSSAYSLQTPFSNAVWAVLTSVLLCACVADLWSNQQQKFQLVCRVTAGLLVTQSAFMVFGAVIKGLQLKNHSFSGSLYPRLTDGLSIGSVFLRAYLIVCGLWFFVAERNAELNRMAATDPLTGALNRGALEVAAARELARRSRTNAPLAVILLDIDHFKELNDSFGHLAGDAALRALVDLMKFTLRGTDVIARTGGEEFVVLLPGTDLQEAQEIAERLRRAVEALRVPVTQYVLQFTASMGVVQVSACDPDFEAIRGRADRLLYRAKRAGRNRVVSESSSDDLVIP